MDLRFPGRDHARMPQGNWRRVLLIGPFAVKIPRGERAAGAMCLNRWEHEMWSVWRPRFGWQHLCPVLWCDPSGRILIMRRATLDATDEEIKALDLALDLCPEPTCEYKPEDWGHLDGRLVVLDYGYACHSDEEITNQRAYYAAAWKRRPLSLVETERKMYRAHISEKDFKQALRFIDAAQATDISTVEHEALVIAGIIAYARPFTSNERPEKGKPLPAAAASLEEVDFPALGVDAHLHERIVKLRMKAVAHSEAELNPMKFDGMAFVSRPWHPVGAGIDLAAFRDMAAKLHQHCLNQKADLSRAVSAMRALSRADSS